MGKTQKQKKREIGEDDSFYVGATKARPFVNRRFQVLSLPDLVNHWADQLIREGALAVDLTKRENLTDFLYKLGKGVIFDLRLNMARAAERAFGELQALMEDPGYYDTVKERRRRDKAKQEEYKKEREEERLKREQRILTGEEKARLIMQLEYDRKYHQQALSRIDTELFRLRSDEDDDDVMVM